MAISASSTVIMKLAVMGVQSAALPVAQWPAQFAAELVALLAMPLRAP